MRTKICIIQLDNHYLALVVLHVIWSKRSNQSYLSIDYQHWLLTLAVFLKPMTDKSDSDVCPYGSHGGSLFPTGIKFDRQDLSSLLQEILSVELNSCTKKWASMASVAILRMLGTFNQHLPMILAYNYWCQKKSISFLDTSMDVKLTESSVMSCSMKKSP